MKIVSFLLILSLSFQLKAQNSYSAVSADESAFFFQDQDENGNPIGEAMFMAGCNWYCGGNVQKITTSSALSPYKTNNYDGTNAHDFNLKTAWVEGKEDYGIGESISYSFNFDQLPNYTGKLGINQLIIANGYGKNGSAWENNSRIQQMALYVDDELVANIDLLDQLEIQTVAIDEILFPAHKTTTLKFVIVDVYEGKKYKDTALSILVFDGVGVH